MFLGQGSNKEATWFALVISTLIVAKINCWPLNPSTLQFFTFYFVLRSDFFPVALRFARSLPVIGAIVRLPIIAQVCACGVVWKQTLMRTLRVSFGRCVRARNVPITRRIPRRSLFVN